MVGEKALRPGRKIKQYDRGTQLEIARLIDERELSLKKMVRKMHTSRVVFLRNMRDYYGSEQWEAIIEDYRSRRGVQPGERRGRGTEFKKGTLRYINARRWRPIGGFQLKRRWYTPPGKSRKKAIKWIRWIKVKDEPYGKYNWMEYARYLWIKNCGPIPKGKVVVHLDGKTLNNSLENLFCMTRGDYLRYLDAKFPKQEILARAEDVGFYPKEVGGFPRGEKKDKSNQKVLGMYKLW